MIMSDCIFCKIVAGELPAVKVYEDDDVLAFMDIGPLVKGHTLVIPKLHCDPLSDVPADLLAKVISVVQRVMSAQMKGLNADGVNVHQSNGAVAGQVVPHTHFHVVPRFSTDGYSWNWKPKSYDDPNEAQMLADSIAKEMGS